MKKTSTRSAASGALISILTACASDPTPKQVSSAYYGKDMQPSECSSIANSFMADTLKDPSSAQFRDQPCFKGFWGASPILGMGVEFGWVQKGLINGKNSYGGYVGFVPYQVLMRDGEVIRYCMSDKDGICIPAGR